MKLNLTGKMVAYFLVAVLVSASGFGYIYYNLTTLTGFVEIANDQELPRLKKANDIAYNAMAHSAYIRGFLLTGDEKFIQEYEQVEEANSKLTQELVDMARTEQLRAVLTEIKLADDKYSDIIETKVIPLKRAGKADEALQVNRDLALPAMQALIKQVNDYKKGRNEAADQALLQAVETARQSKLIVMMTALVSLIIGIGIGIFSARNIAKPVQSIVEIARSVASGNLRQNIEVTRQDEIGQLQQAFSEMTRDLRNMVRQIQESAGQVAASSEELTASAEQSAQSTNQIAESVATVAGGTDRQAGAVNEAAAIIEQMSGSTEQIAANASLVADVAGKTATAAQAGSASIETAIKQMAYIEKTVDNSAYVVEKLGERSKAIGQIVDTISGIAGQTNLLALNAAIEAARAGEQGRGFAVVAEEVRKLAEQSQEATKNIANLIGEIQDDTEQAVSAMNVGTKEARVGSTVVNTAGEAFTEIKTLVEQVSSQVKEISAAIQQMASGSQHVVDSIRSIDTISKENAGQTQTVSAAAEEQLASIEEIASSSQNLEKMAQELQNIVRKFKV
ncbi:MAG: Methyl-accepting chemotaxis protein signaling domain protein [Firmicutes bacterium]|nr:Methyl-accepting chemotaxis protein signaling domain protein [Bacillota bacterium]